MSSLPFGYSKFINSLAQKLVDIDSDTHKCMLLNGYTVGTTPDTAQFVSDVLAVATEASGTGYTSGGQALTGVTWTQSGGVWTFDCDDVVWNPASLTATHALFYDSTPSTNATRPVIGCWDFGGAQVTTTAFTLTINAAGLFTFTNVTG